MATILTESPGSALWSIIGERGSHFGFNEGMLAVQITVTGRVQGVGFRWWAQNTARALGLAGEVRNLPDGDVEITAQGEPDAVRRLLRFAIEQPTTTGRPGWVQDFQLSWPEPVVGRVGFRVGW